MTEESSIRVLSVVHHPLFREGIASVVTSQADMLLAAEASSAGEALQQFRKHRPDVTLMDLRLPDASGIEAMIGIREQFPDARVILLFNFENDVEIEPALQAGAWGCILKTMPPREMVEMIRQVYGGTKGMAPPIAARPAEHADDEALTAREVEILAHVAGGGGNHGLGHRPLISEDTVKAHMKLILQKLGACDRTNALTIAARRGIIRL